MNALKPGFVYDFRVRNRVGRIVDSWRAYNLVPASGLAFLARSPFGETPPISSFYVGLYLGNYTPTPGSSAADIPSAMAELTAYSQAERPLWERVYDSGTHTNDASPAEFTLTQDVVIRGSFLVSSAIKGGNTGTMLSVLRQPSPKSVYAGSTIEVVASLTYLPTSI